MAPERRMVSEDGILEHRFPRSDRLKEPPKMWTQVIVIIPAIGLGFKRGLFAGNRVMFLMPLLGVSTPEAAGIGACVVAGAKIYARLWQIANAGPTKFDDALRAHEACDLSRFCAQR